MEPLQKNRSLIPWRRNYMNSGVTKNLRTICEVLRELHRDAEEREDTVSMQRLEEANDMAKRMQDRLKFYSLLSKSTKSRDVTLVVDDVGVMYWLTKTEYKRGEARRRKRGKIHESVK
jgi:hypothetical protein